VSEDHGAHNGIEVDHLGDLVCVGLIPHAVSHPGLRVRHLGPGGLLSLPDHPLEPLQLALHHLRQTGSPLLGDLTGRVQQRGGCPDPGERRGDFVQPGALVLGDS
jgi:hypothetical protein